MSEPEDNPDPLTVTLRADVVEQAERQVGPAWMAKPIGNGWYFYADDPAEWDLAIPVGVSRHEYGSGGVWLEVRHNGQNRKVDLMPGIWWGPLPAPSLNEPPLHLIPRKGPPQ
jgi:hypothetical protein